MSRRSRGRRGPAPSRALVEASPATELVIDVAAATISAGDRVFQAKLSDSTRKSLVEGRWDALGELLEGKGAADAVAARLPAIAPASGTHLGPERRPA